MVSVARVSDKGVGELGGLYLDLSCNNFCLGCVVTSLPSRAWSSISSLIGGWWLIS